MTAPRRQEQGDGCLVVLCICAAALAAPDGWTWAVGLGLFAIWGMHT